VTQLDVDTAIPFATAAEFERCLASTGPDTPDVVVAIHNQRSGRQTVTLTGLQEAALCHGWVDTQTKRIDEQRYAIRFVRRRAGSNWSPRNREMARRLLSEGRVSEAGLRTLPPDL
jgi:uncharacterized protein YdeI (YjbR/CyaY-like superfamily)